MPATKAEFNPHSSQTNPGSRADFVTSVVTGDLKQVAGISEGQEKLLKKAGVTNTFQLAAKFLSFTPDPKSDGKTDCVEHCNKFFQWLRSIGCSVMTHDIVQAMAEKVDCSYPGMYDEGKWQAPK